MMTPRILHFFFMTGMAMTAFLSASAQSLKMSLTNGETVEYKSEEVTSVEFLPADTDAPLNLLDRFGMGWNMGNQFDAFANGVASETCWGNPKATQQLFDFVASSGIKTVRIPITWLGHVGAAPDYKIDTAWLDRIAEVVGYAEKSGLNAIINIHHDGAESKHWLDIKGAATDQAKNDAVKAQLAAMWTQIADRFQDKGDWLVFEALNEIHDGGWGWGANRNDGGKQYRTLNEWNQTFVDAVRSTGGKNATRILGVPAYCTNIDIALHSFVIPEDPAGKTVLSVHFYDPYEYTLNYKYSEWGHTGKDKESWGDEQNVRENFAKVRANFIDKGIPAYIGEMGNVNRPADRAKKFRRYYLEYVVKAAHDEGIPCIIWDNGALKEGAECSGIFDRAKATFYGDGAETISVMVKAATSSDPAYTLQSVYDSAPE